ncbi:MAG: DUF3343 domain-containing protein [Anaerolineae bacterium]|nr:DUF3343 domain-containing protein [Anaerolineae bacterium]
MTWRDRYTVFLVKSTGHAIRAEQVLNMAGIACKLIPVPRQISSNCGTCVRVERMDVEAAKAVFVKSKVEFESVHEI